MVSSTEYTLLHGNHDATGKKLAAGLGWFGIALGALELVATRALTTALGMRGNEDLVRLYGIREIASGIGILTSKDPTPWVWSRVIGDGLDLGTLAAHYTDENPNDDNVGLALLNVAAVTALDIYCAQRLSRENAGESGARLEVPPRDYSDRSGLPKSPAEMRGAAGDFEAPRDMRGPEAMRPWQSGQA